MVDIVKACIYCKHCCYDEAVWYSDLTGGDDASWACNKGRFDYNSLDNMLEGEMYEMSLNCEHFEVRDFKS